jgi:peptidoglycan/LPS O-acetylase OafA/YrhL
LPEGGLGLVSGWARRIAAGDSARIVATGSDPGKGRRRHGARFGAGLRAEAIGPFLVARLSRIYPLRLVTLLAVMVLEADRRIVGSRRLGVSFFDVPIFVGRSTDTFLTNVFMVQAWGFHETVSWNSPAWFVSVEYFLYLVCPVLMLFVGGRFGWRAATLGAASFVFLVALAENSGVGLDMTSRYGL